MRKSRDSKARAEAEFAEREIKWAEVKAKEKADISRFADKAMEKTKLETRARKNTNTINRAEVKAATKIRFVTISREKKERGRRL